jgi:hypothetical protein
MSYDFGCFFCAGGGAEDLKPPGPPLDSPLFSPSEPGPAASDDEDGSAPERGRPPRPAATKKSFLFRRIFHGD